MSTARVFNRQTGYIAVAVALLLTTFISALVSAAQVTERSIQLSSSSKGATDVSYTINFKATGAASAFVVDFCSNSPLLGQDCTPPAGLKVDTATTANADYTINDAATTESTLVVDSAITVGESVSLVVEGATNPTSDGTLYARIATFGSTTAAADYLSTAPGATVDEGGVAISITPTVAISGDVLESLTFCISGSAIDATCTGSLTAPVLKLGEPMGNGVVALDSTKLSTGNIHTQLTTNAVNGATVYLKSDATGCGGLVDKSRPGSCDIKPALLADFAAGTAAFGVKTATATSTPTALFADAIGVLKPAGVYSSGSYAFNWITGDQTGVTSTFGDVFLATDGEPVNNQNLMLTFGTSVNGNTPAGSYSTALSLIATGKF